MRRSAPSCRSLRRPIGAAAALAMTAIALVPGLAQANAPAGGELTLYTTREVALVQPLLSAFTAKTGTRVNTVFVKADSSGWTSATSRVV